MGMSMTSAQSQSLRKLESEGWMTGDKGYFLESPANGRDYGTGRYANMTLKAYKLVGTMAYPAGVVKIAPGGDIDMPRKLANIA